MAQAQRLRLTHVHDGNARWANGLNFRQQLTLNALLQQGFQFVGGVEVVFHGVFRGVGDQDDFFDPCSNNFVDDVLDHRLVNDR